MALPSVPAPTLSGSCRIVDRGVIRARGADAATFLQGQLTNDVASMPGDVARLAGFCSAKGRLQASFIVLRPAPDEFLLVCAADVLAATLKRLSMFVLRAKCVLSDAGAELALVGVAAGTGRDGASATAPWHVEPHGGGHAVQLPPAAGIERRLLIVPAAEAAGAPSGSLTLDGWRWLEVESGVVGIEAATVDRFVPQMVNHELIGAVDFKKGCYPGQEVVARSQYRGTTKRRTFLYDVDALARPGDDVYGPEPLGEAVGTVANAAPRPDGGSSALVEVRLAAIESTLHLGAADGPALRQRDLPYAVPIENEATS
ncbi:MAG: folate-binding protein [Pseudomonadota bacterium]|nr:folate-binding protein [Pseudomonadota bacterium]